MKGLTLKLKLQYFGHLTQRVNSLEKTLMLERIEGRKRRGWQRMRWFDSITDSMNTNLSELREILEDRGAWHAAVHGVTKSWTGLKKRQAKIYCQLICTPRMFFRLKTKVYRRNGKCLNQ